MKRKRYSNIFTVNIIPILFGTIISGLILGIFLPIAGSQNQVYTDIISEVSVTNTNKSGELNVVWIALIIGTISIVICRKILEKNTAWQGIDIINQEKLINISKWNIYGIGILIIPMLVIWIVKLQLNVYLLVISIVYFMGVSILNKQKMQPHRILLLMFIVYMFFLSLKAIVNTVVDNSIINEKSILVFSFIIVSAIIYYSYTNNRFKFIDKCILIFQLPLPLILLTYIIDRYTYKSEIIKIHFTKTYIVVISILIILLILFNIIQYLKRMKLLESLKFSELIFLPTVIITFVLYYYSSPQQIHSSDLWHLGELMLPWDQLIDKGLIGYEQYSSASGLYPLLFGFFHNVVLDGTVLSYAGASALQNIFFAICIGMLCYYTVGGGFSLFIAIMIPITYYSRPLIFLPIFLILLLPKLIKSRVRWLQVWFVCCLVAGLYYPLNGVAIAVGILPFAIVQLLLVIKEKSIKNEMRKKKFHIMNLICILSLVLLSKTLIRMLKHVLALSSQSVLADGISVYKVTQVQSWFMPYITNEKLRKGFYTITIYLIPIFVFLLFAYILYIYLTQKCNLSMIEKLNSPGFLLIGASTIALPINYAYTFIRVDQTAFLVRTGCTIEMFAIILCIFLWKYGKGLFDDITRFALIGICIGISFLNQGINVGTESSKIMGNYSITNDYIYIDGKDIGIPKLGKGFLLPETENRLKTIKEVIDKTVYKDETFLDMSFSQELYYIFDKKVPVPNAGTYVVASGEASLTNIEAMKKNPPPVIVWKSEWYGSAIRNYYMYRWIMDQGYILYTYKGENFLIRPDRYNEIFGDAEKAHQNMIKSSDANTYVTNLQGTPNAWGKSINTLMYRFNKYREYKLEDFKIYANQMQISKKENNQTSFTIEQQEDPFLRLEFPEYIKGSDTDFLYLKLNSNNASGKRVQIFWETNESKEDEKRSLVFDYGTGEFLIPLGVHPGWSFAQIKSFRIDVDGFPVGSQFTIENIKFLKLNEASQYK